MFVRLQITRLYVFLAADHLAYVFDVLQEDLSNDHVRVCVCTYRSHCVLVTYAAC